MRYILIALLIVVFGYSLALVLQNQQNFLLICYLPSSSYAFRLIIATHIGTRNCGWSF